MAASRNTKPNSDSDPYYELLPSDTDPARLKRERDKSRKLKKSQWWHRKIGAGICYYCQNKFPPSELTMDHVVPLARGGKSQPGNIVPACVECNREKKLRTPAEELLTKKS